MADQEFTQKITTETDQSGVNQAVRGNEQLEQSTRNVDDQAERTSSTMRERFGGALGFVANNITAVLAVGAGLVKLFLDMSSAAKQAAQANQELGESMRGLTANVGADLARTASGAVDLAAAQSRFNVEGRNQLLAATTTLTDLRPGMNEQQVLQGVSNLALLQRATGIKGEPGAELIVSTSGNLGVSDATSVDVLTNLLNAGVDESVLARVVGRFGRGGGMEFLAAASGAQQFGLNLRNAEFPGLISALTRTDAEGNVATELQAAGITEEMNITERLRMLGQARQAGEISDAEFARAIGGEANRGLAEPMMQFMLRGNMDAAVAALTDPNVAEDTVSRLQQNELIRAQERQNLRELFVQLRRERSQAAGRGEAVQTIESVTEDLPGIIRGPARGFGALLTYLTPESEEQFERALNQQEFDIFKRPVEFIGDPAGGGPPAGARSPALSDEQLRRTREIAQDYGRLPAGQDYVPAQTVIQNQTIVNELNQYGSEPPDTAPPPEDRIPRP